MITGPLFSKRQRGILRVASYAAALLSVTIWGLAKYSVAKAGETSLTVGRELYELRDLLNQGEKVEINGETMYFTAQASDQSVDVVLDRVAKYCEGHPNAVEPLFSKAPPGKGPAGMGVVKRFSADDGVVSCLARGESSPEGVGPALNAFFKTQNLGELGMMRYVYVRKPANGVGSQVMAAWTDQKFNMGAFIPDEKGDARGQDAKLAPRPPSSVRRFSARIAGGAYGATIYRTTLSRDDVFAFYEKELGGRGWFASKENVDVTTGGAGDALRKGQTGKLYVKAPDLSVLVSVAENEGERLVNLVEGTVPTRQDPVSLR